MTENEKSILCMIARSEFNAVNGQIPQTPEESATWLFIDELADDSNLTINQVKGVLGSLVKKELIFLDSLDDTESLVSLSQDGINFLW